MGIKFYFADAYSAWQSGSIDNSNGLLREYYPNKTNLSKVEEKELIGCDIKMFLLLALHVLLSFFLLMPQLVEASWGS